ncbi:hypothetical protein [Pseudonocardia spinosispora]|nr:hypothetical protein [Pseudonocardia spinosispora]
MQSSSTADNEPEDQRPRIDPLIPTGFADWSRRALDLSRQRLGWL